MATLSIYSNYTLIKHIFLRYYPINAPSFYQSTFFFLSIRLLLLLHVSMGLIHSSTHSFSLKHSVVFLYRSVCLSISSWHQRYVMSISVSLSLVVFVLFLVLCCIVLAYLLSATILSESFIRPSSCFVVSRTRSRYCCYYYFRCCFHYYCCWWCCCDGSVVG